MKQLLSSVKYTLLSLFTLLWVFPFIWMVSSSLKEDVEFLTEPLKIIPDTLLWENYLRAWDVANFSVYFKNSMVVTVIAVFIAVFLSAITGYALGRVDFAGKKLFIVLMAATLFIPKGYIIIPFYQVIKHLGLLNSLPGLIVAESAGAHVLFILLFMTHFRAIPNELEEAAEIDGAGFVRTFFSVMLPLAKPMIATAIVMQFMWTWNSFFVPLVLTLNNPGLRTLTVGMYSFLGEYDTDWTGLSAAATISVLPIIIIFLFLQRYFIRGISGAIKQ